jgi:hypothetical protein
MATYVAISFFGWVMHWLLHQKFMGQFYRSHMTHHMICYPSNDMLSKKYRAAGLDNTIYFFIFASIPMLSIPIFLYIFGIIPTNILIISLFEMLILGVMNNYIHDAMHIENHWLQNFPIGRFWRKLHYYHHLDMSCNMGIFIFWIDKLFKTFKY